MPSVDFYHSEETYEEVTDPDGNVWFRIDTAGIWYPKILLKGWK
jgi:hypothetical protein